MTGRPIPPWPPDDERFTRTLPDPERVYAAWWAAGVPAEELVSWADRVGDVDVIPATVAGDHPRTWVLRVGSREIESWISGDATAARDDAKDAYGGCRPFHAELYCPVTGEVESIRLGRPDGGFA